MKVKNLNLTLEWQTIRNIPDFLKIDTHFPTYNVKVKNENDYLIHQNLNLNNHEFIMESNLQYEDFMLKPKLSVEISKNKTKNIFKYNFENNYLKYKELNNKLGFFKKIKFEVDYNNDGKGDFELKAEYAEIENLDKNIAYS